MSMTEPRELLIHELGDLYYAEQLLTKALPTLAEEADDSELQQGSTTTSPKPNST